MDGSSFSSFYSSFIKTTDGSESPPDTEKDPKHRKLKVRTVQSTMRFKVSHFRSFAEHEHI